MSNGDWSVPPAFQTVPPFAGPNDPAIAFGTDPIPAELITYYTGLGETIIAVLIFRRTATDYIFDALVIDAGSNAVRAIGGYFGIVIENARIRPNGAIWSFVADVEWKNSAIAAFRASATLQLDVGSLFTADGISQGRGGVGFTAITATTGFTVAGAELVVITTPAITLRDDRAYMIEFEGDVESTAANGFASLQIRRTNLAGVLLRDNGGFGLPATAGFGQTSRITAVVKNSTGADISSVLVGTIQPFIAGQVRMVAAANRLGYIKTTDIGDANDYPNATAL